MQKPGINNSENNAENRPHAFPTHENSIDTGMETMHAFAFSVPTNTKRENK